MAPTLVLRPFSALNNTVLTFRNRETDFDRGKFYALTQQLKARGHTPRDDTAETIDSGQMKVSGLVNNANFCFMNAVLQVRRLCRLANGQALASLPEFITYLEIINDGPTNTPVSSALFTLLNNLNTYRSGNTALYPDKLASALLQSDKNRLLATREQQDAQEFFSLLINTLESESAKQWLLVNKPPGLESLVSVANDEKISVETPAVSIPSPFDGLSANRMGCLRCKYVETIRHELFGPMVLPLTKQENTTLHNCLAETFEMETLDQVDCTKCTLLEYETKMTQLPTITSPGLRTAMERRLEDIQRALESGKLDTIAQSEWLRHQVKSSKTKHFLIARAPPVLVFHIQRSTYHMYSGRAMKLQTSVTFPEELDMSDFITTSRLSMNPEEPISTWRDGDVRTKYRLRSVIVHYGVHHMGHYVAFRRTDEGWFRISDEDVEYAPPPT
jgi:ubiquitin carboxyl-terminal hydrolase 1